MESRNDSAEVAGAKACLDAFRKRSAETSECHASNPGAGAGNSRRLIEISSAHKDLIVTEIPRDALTYLSSVLRGFGVYGAVQIGRGKFSEVYSCRNDEGSRTGRAVKVSKTASSLVSIKEGQAGTEAFAMHLGDMCAKTGGLSPFLSASRLLAVPAAGGQYVAVLLMKEAKGTATELVTMLANGIMSHGSFSLPGLEKAGVFVQKVLERLSALHSLRIAHRDLKPANLLMNGDNAVFLSDPGMAIFPTSMHRPAPSLSPEKSPPTPRMPTPLATGRAIQIFQAATGQVARRFPPENQAGRSTLIIDPTELETIFSQQFRNRNNAGTHVFTGPEFPFKRNRGTMTSSDFLPGDMWAVGIILLRILSGDKVLWMKDTHEKTTMANSSPQDFWAEYLHCSGTPSADPAVLHAVDLVRGLLRADPAERLTCSTALAHPFLQRP